MLNELFLEDRCASYVEQCLVALANSIDGELILETVNLNELRTAWIQSEFHLKDLRRFKRFVECTAILNNTISWLVSVLCFSSILFFEMEEV